LPSGVSQGCGTCREVMAPQVDLVFAQSLGLVRQIFIGEQRFLYSRVGITGCDEYVMGQARQLPVQGVFLAVSCGDSGVSLRCTYGTTRN